MIRIVLLFIWILSCSVFFYKGGKFAMEETRSDSPVVAQSVFGVRVSIGSNSELCTFVCFLYNGRVLTQKRILDEQSFIKIVSGEWPSIYNPKRINYFEENGVSCGTVFDSTTFKRVGLCNPLDSLWKIRFGTYPFQHRTDLGWSNKYHKPSPKQEKYIFDRYDVDHVDTKFFLDTNFWRLLKDVEDTAWIRNYKSLR